MRHALIDFDSKIPNLALMKLSTHLKAKGGSVDLIRPEWKHSRAFMPRTFRSARYDQLWLSCIFTWHRDEAMRLIQTWPHVIYGGTGFDWGIGDGIDLSGRIALDPEVENLKPDYSLYPKDKRAIGFCVRGVQSDVWVL